MSKDLLDLRKLFSKDLLKNPLLAGSFIIFCGNMISNAVNYLFHLAMGRMLGPVDYGVLESLISLFYLLGIPMGAFSLVIVKYVSSYKGQERWGAIGKFFKRLNYEILKFGIVGFFLYLLLTPLLRKFLHLDTTLPLLVVGLTTLLGLFSGINRSFLQGLLKFAANSLSGAFEVIIRLILAVFLVFLGFRFTGAVTAALVAAVAGYFLTFWLVKDVTRKVNHQEVLGRKGMATFFLPSLFSTMALTSLFTTDVFLARHFLPEFEAGLYAALATLGKIIFFLTGSISMVMFPLVSEAGVRKRPYNYLFWQSFGLVFPVCLGMTVLYFLFPQVMVGILYGPKFMAAAEYLGFFAVFLSLYSLSFLFVNFFLSISNLKAVILPVLASITQVILIFFFHSSIQQMVTNSILVSALLLVALLVYYFLYGREGGKAPSSVGSYSSI